MPDEKNPVPVEENEFMKKMKAIASDFWGEKPAESKEEPEKPKAAPKAPKPRKQQNGLDTLWKVADETVDWTDALSHATPSDGLTSQLIWSFYHERAARVLSGDLDAYTAGLIKSNPLGELTDYADSIQIKAVSPSRLESSFVCRPAHLKADPKRYLSAMGLRIARDLLACLPVDEVAVTAKDETGVVMEAVYPRKQMLHRNFNFVDPVELTEECGGKFHLK